MLEMAENSWKWLILRGNCNFFLVYTGLFKLQTNKIKKITLLPPNSFSGVKKKVTSYDKYGRGILPSYELIKTILFSPSVQAVAARA